MESGSKKKKLFPILDLLKKEPDTLLEKLVDQSVEAKYLVGFLHSPNGDKTFSVTTMGQGIDTLEKLEERHLRTLLEMIKSKAPDQRIVNVRVNDLFYTHSVSYLEGLLAILLAERPIMELDVEKPTERNSVRMHVRTEDKSIHNIDQLSVEELDKMIFELKKSKKAEFVNLRVNDSERTFWRISFLESMLKEKQAMKEAPIEEPALVEEVDEYKLTGDVEKLKAYVNTQLQEARSWAAQEIKDTDEYVMSLEETLGLVQDQLGKLNYRVTELVEKALKQVTDNGIDLRKVIDQTISNEQMLKENEEIKNDLKTVMIAVNSMQVWTKATIRAELLEQGRMDYELVHMSLSSLKKDVAELKESIPAIHNRISEMGNRIAVKEQEEKLED